jgi:hypothetical protein
VTSGIKPKTIQVVGTEKGKEKSKNSVKKFDVLHQDLIQEPLK